MEKIIILGIGNILLRDEGFGVRVVEELTRRYRFPENVQVLDGGTLGMELLRYLMGADKLVLVDAVAGELPPGSLYEFKNEAVKAYFKEKVSMHELGIQDVLAALDILEKPIKEVMIIGVQPLSMEIGLELTTLLFPVVNQAVDKVIQVLTSWQVEVVVNNE
jgi:hydrogenase maturation protease